MCLTFATKQALAAGWWAECWTPAYPLRGSPADEAYGHDSKFRRSVAGRGIGYVSPFPAVSPCTPVRALHGPTPSSPAHRRRRVTCPSPPHRPKSSQDLIHFSPGEIGPRPIPRATPSGQSSHSIRRIAENTRSASLVDRVRISESTSSGTVSRPSRTARSSSCICASTSANELSLSVTSSTKPAES